MPQRTIQADVPRTVNPRINRRNSRRNDPFDVFNQNPFDLLNKSPMDILNQGLLGGGRRTRRNYTSNDTKLLVKPLPENNFEQDYIPVGNITSKQSSIPKILKKDGDLSFIIVVEGDANLRSLSMPENSNEYFNTYIEEEDVETWLVDSTIKMRKRFNVALVPRKSGKSIVPSFEFHSFNTTKKSYEKHTFGGNEVNISELSTNNELVTSREITPKKDQTRLGKTLSPSSTPYKFLYIFKPLVVILWSLIALTIFYKNQLLTKIRRLFISDKKMSIKKHISEINKVKENNWDELIGLFN